MAQQPELEALRDRIARAEQRLVEIERMREQDATRQLARLALGQREIVVTVHRRDDLAIQREIAAAVRLLGGDLQSLRGDVEALRAAVGTAQLEIIDHMNRRSTELPAAISGHRHNPDTGEVT